MENRLGTRVRVREGLVLVLLRWRTGLGQVGTSPAIGPIKKGNQGVTNVIVKNNNMSYINNIICRLFKIYLVWQVGKDD
jgi:hypothetical protein